MANCTSYNCDPLAPQVLNDCDSILNGSGAEVVVFSCGNLPTDPTDGTEVAALIASGDAVIFKNVMAELPEGSPQEIAGLHSATARPTPELHSAIQRISGAPGACSPSSVYDETCVARLVARHLGTALAVLLR